MTAVDVRHNTSFLSFFCQKFFLHESFCHHFVILFLSFDYFPYVIHESRWTIVIIIHILYNIITKNRCLNEKFTFLLNVHNYYQRNKKVYVLGHLIFPLYDYSLFYFISFVDRIFWSLLLHKFLSSFHFASLCFHFGNIIQITHEWRSGGVPHVEMNRNEQCAFMWKRLHFATEIIE